jgi:hypothetical protein
MPNLTFLISGIVGAFLGIFGWLFVGLYIQRRQFIRQAKNAARAVYFEIDLNRVNVQVGRKYGSYTPLSRTSFDRLLPELATWLRLEERARVRRSGVASAVGRANSKFPTASED